MELRTARPAALKSPVGSCLSPLGSHPSSEPPEGRRSGRRSVFSSLMSPSRPFSGEGELRGRRELFLPCVVSPAAEVTVTVGTRTPALACRTRGCVYRNDTVSCPRACSLPADLSSPPQVQSTSLLGPPPPMKIAQGSVRVCGLHVCHRRPLGLLSQNRHGLGGF